MSDPDRAREPSMEEILASIRRIISDDRKEQRSEAREEPAPVRAGEMSVRREPPGRQEMAGPDEPAEEFGAAEEPAAEADVLAVADAEARERIGARLEERREEEPPASLARTREPGVALAQASAEESAGRFAEPEAGYESMAEPTPEAGFRGRSEEELDASFALRRGRDVEALPRADTKLKAEAPAAMEEPAAMDEPAAMEQAAPIEEESRLISSRTDASVASAFASLENFVLSTHSRTLEDLVSEMLRPLLKAWLDANLPPLVERLVREEIERVSRGRR